MPACRGQAAILPGRVHPPLQTLQALSASRSMKTAPIADRADRPEFPSPAARRPAEARGSSPKRAPSALWVLLLLFVLYNSNLRVIHIDDSVTARLLPFALLVKHTIYLDQWIGPYRATAVGPYKTYFVAPYHGHWVSCYPLALPLVITPLYVLPAWWFAHLRPLPVPGDITFMTIVNAMEKLSASLLAALSATLLYLAFRRIASPAVSLVVALIYAVGSDTWTISSQALWKQDLAELSFAFFLWAMLRSTERRGYSFLAGLALAVAAANKPPEAIFALLFFFHFLRWPRRSLALYLAPLVTLGLLTMAYNHHFLGRIWGYYPSPLSPAEQHAYLHQARSPFGEGLAGLWLSPNRGLLIYSPWVVFALWGAARIWKENLYGWGRWLIVGTALTILGYAQFASWWGGWCYGPRNLTDLMPFFAFFLLPVVPRLHTSLPLRAAFVLAVAGALWVQIVGAYYYPSGWWDGRPISVDRAPRRLWDFSDTQISRSFLAGPAQPELYYNCYILLSHRSK